MNKIPKIVHLYWGKNPMSWLQAQTPITFHMQNPDWEIRVYTPKQDPTPLRGHLVPDYTGKDYFGIVKALDYVTFVEIDLMDWGIDGVYHGSLQSDIFRDFLLYEYGGIWSDFDVLWLKPITHLSAISTLGNGTSNMGAITAYYKNNRGHHNVSILMASPKHELFSLLKREIKKIQRVKKDHDKLDLQEFGACLWNRLMPTFETAIKLFPDIVGLPYTTFYPYSIFELDRLYKKIDLSCIDDSVVAIHWFNGANLSKEFVNSGMKNHKCTMYKVLQDLKLITPPKISIVMAYFNRRIQLYQTLKSISKTAHTSFEVILIDDNSEEMERVEDLTLEFPFLRIYRVTKEEKNYSCSCMAFNRGIAMAEGQIIILQNPECEHVGDVLMYVDKNLTDSNFLSFACFAPDYRDNKGWYNHPIYRPVYYHFCSAITKANMNALGGFDERYAQGAAYDDNEFIERVVRLGLKKDIPTDPYVIHQQHSKNYGIPKKEYLTKLERNRAIYEILTLKETSVRKENCYE